MPEQGQGKAAGCFPGSSRHNERPEAAKQEGTFCSEPVQAKANSPAPPPTPCSPPSLLEVWTRPQQLPTRPQQVRPCLPRWGGEC